MSEHPTLQNVTEELVFSHLQTMKDTLPCCTCERCCLDIAAIALNHLPPKYVVTREGALYSKLEACAPQQIADVATAVMNAALLVKEHPRHTASPESAASSGCSAAVEYPENTVAVQSDDPQHPVLRPVSHQSASQTVKVQLG